MISCTRCGGAIQETDVTCPHCGAALAQQAKGPAEASSTAKAGGAIGAAGSIAMFVQNLMIVIGLLLLVVSFGAVFSDPSAAFDQAFVGVILIMYSFYVDYLGLAIIGVGLVVISVGLRKVVSGKTMALGLTAGIMCILWVVLTYLWRVYYPGAMAESLSVLLEDIMGLSGTTAGTFDTIIDQVQGMMYTWIGASVLLIIASFVFAFFISGVGKDTNYPGKLRSYSWPIFTIVNGVGTILVATFVLGALNLSFNPVGLLAGLFIKGLVVPIIALYVYISLLRKFLKLGKVTEHPAPVAYPAAPPAPAYYPPPPAAPAPAAPGEPRLSRNRPRRNRHPRKRRNRQKSPDRPWRKLLRRNQDHSPCRDYASRAASRLWRATSSACTVGREWNRRFAGDKRIDLFAR